MNGKNIWMWATAALLCVTLAVSYTTIHYYNEAEAYKSDYNLLRRDLEDLTMLVNLKIDYGNGTVVWNNNTRVPLDATLLTATKMVAHLDYTVSEYGAFANKINGVGGDPNLFWLWDYWDLDSGSWVFGPVGCDQWTLHNGDMVSWTYTSF